MTAPAQTEGRKASFLRELVETLLLTALIFFSVRAVVQSFRVEGMSMEPSLLPHQLVLVNKAVYWRVDQDSRLAVVARGGKAGNGQRYIFRGPRRGEVIVFRSPFNPSEDYIKRVIGVPGDTVRIRDGRVYLNGERLEEPYIGGALTEASPYSKRAWKVPPGKYFVLGDNRFHSSDSRSWDFVPIENIVGRALFTYWPVSRWGPVPGGAAQPAASESVQLRLRYA